MTFVSRAITMNRIKLNVKTRAPIVERTDRPPCEICKRQISRYVCPTCNLPYCSIECFKSENHAECSDTFYRKEIETEIKLDPKKSTDEKRTMMELLRKFEEESAQQPDLLTEDQQIDDEDQEGLASKLEGLDLDETDTNTLWSLLSPAQRNKFLQAMRDPSSKLAQQLLVGEELSEYHLQPWWESPALQTDQPTPEAPESKLVRYGSIPDMMPIPEQLLASARNATPSSLNVTLLYNILATCLAYAYVTRKLLISPLSSIKMNDPDRKIARDLFNRVAPFLTEKRSTQVFSSVDDIVTFFWSKLDTLSDIPTDTSIAKLLTDTTSLLKPQSITTISSDDIFMSSPSRTTLLVLSDISRLFTDIKYISHKLNFYAAQLCVHDSLTLKAVVEETRITALKIQSEARNHSIDQEGE